MKQSYPDILDPSHTTKQKQAYGLLVTANPTLTRGYKIVESVYNSRLDGYEDYLDLNFDGTHNLMSIIWKI